MGIRCYSISHGARWWKEVDFTSVQRAALRVSPSSPAGCMVVLGEIVAAKTLDLAQTREKRHKLEDDNIVLDHLSKMHSFLRMVFRIIILFLS